MHAIYTTVAVLSRWFARLPEFTAVGLVVFVLGVAADLVAHALNTPFLVVGGIDRTEATAHALVVAGVALTLGGLAVGAVGLQRGRVDNSKGATGTPNLD